MRAHLPAVLILVGVAALASCTSASRVVTRDAMAHDVRKLGRLLRTTHPAVGLTVRPGALDTLATGIVAELPPRATVAEFASLAQPLIDTLRGGHVLLYPRGLPWRSTLGRTKRLFPLRLQRLPTGEIYVAGVRTGADSALVGRRVTRLEGYPIDSLVREAAKFKGGSDGTDLSGSYDRATADLSAYLNWQLGQRDSFRVSLAGAVDTTILLAAVDERDLPKAPPTRPINYGFDSVRRIAVVDLNSFSGYDPYNLLYPLVLRRVFAKAHRDSARALLLDLRGNGGGRSANVRRVLSYLVRARTPVYERWDFPASGWWRGGLPMKVATLPAMLLGRGERRRYGRLIRNDAKPRRRAFAGPITVLIDGGTFSAAAVTAAVLKSSGDALLLGQPAGGNYHETYAGLFTTRSLRRTGMRVRVPHFRIAVAVEEARQPFGKTLQPDVALPYTLDNVLDPRDRMLLQALTAMDSALRGVR